jgi:hypothetical protein
MHSILVLFVREEFFQTEAGGRTEATKVTEEKFGTNPRARFLPSHGAGADTLGIHFGNFFAYFLAQVLLSCFMICSRPINDCSPQGG